MSIDNPVQNLECTFNKCAPNFTPSIYQSVCKKATDKKYSYHFGSSQCCFECVAFRMPLLLVTRNHILSHASLELPVGRCVKTAGFLSLLGPVGCKTLVSQPHTSLVHLHPAVPAVVTIAPLYTPLYGTRSLQASAPRVFGDYTRIVHSSMHAPHSLLHQVYLPNLDRKKLRAGPMNATHLEICIIA